MMQARQQLSALAFDLTRLHRRTVTSFYSNLVTRPTGRAVRMGLEQQLSEAAGAGGPCLSILDFSQVRVMDYSCADEIVAKLLLQYAAAERTLEVYFLARGLQEHHLESVEAVLDRHGLLLAAEGGCGATLLGPATPHERKCWEVLVRHGRVRIRELAASSGLPENAIGRMVHRFIAARVAVSLPGDLICPIPQLNDA
ncbi:MAG: hypothetical protein WD766_08660 [Gemmatimonadota bacterium]